MIGHRNTARLPGAWLGCVILLAAGPAWPQGPIATNLPHKGILKVQAPGQLGVAIIDAIADIGAEQVVSFPPLSDVPDFIAKKCGRPSVTVKVHPRYRERLLARNENDATVGQDPLRLTEQRSLTLPACASSFALSQQDFEVPNGIEALMREHSILFDMDQFRRLTQEQDFQAAVTSAYGLLAANPYPQGQPCDADTLEAFFACVNTIEIAYLNRERIRSADQIVGKLRIPVTPVRNVIARIPIAADKAEQVETLAALRSDAEKTQYQRANGILNITPVVGPTAASAAQPITGVGEVRINIPSEPVASARAAAPAPGRNASVPAITMAAAPPVSATIENDIKFVTAVGESSKFDPACSNAHDLNAGRWPFDREEFLRVLALNYDLDAELSGKARVLIVDTGFDFTDDDGKIPPVPERYIFPKESFARNRGRSDADGDGIPNNFNFAGVNLAMNARSAATHILDNTRRRSHGLAVTTLALGGRDLQHLRMLKLLKSKVGIASLVPTTNIDVVLDQGHMQRIMKYATAQANDFNIINLSLSTRDELQGFQDQIRAEGGRVFIAAAGNDETQGHPLHDKEHKIYPAALGGKPRTDRMRASVVITVGAHKGDGKHAEFSYFSHENVDVLAPGCMVPSYELRKDGDTWADPPRVVESYVTGTSFAAPLVSFFVSVLMTDPATAEPGIVKERVIVGTDFDFDLRKFAYSAGKINVAKMLAARYDVIETFSPRGKGQIRFGILTNKNALPNIECGNEPEPVRFEDVKKLAFDRQNNSVLLIWNEERDIPGKLKKTMCQPSVLQNLVYEFEDAETGEILKLTAATQVVDYVARQ